MLFCNGKQYDMTAEDVKKVREYIGEKPSVVLKYPEYAYTPNRASVMNRGKMHKGSRIKRDRLPITLIPMKSLINANGQSELWIYSELPPRVKRDSDPIYSPLHIEIDEVKIIETANNLDLLFFLIFKSNVREGSQFLKTGVRAMFRIENREKEREQRVSLKKYKTQVENVLYNKIKDKDLLDIALAMQINGSSLMGPNELRESIEAKLWAAQKVEAYEKFMELCRPDEVSQKNPEAPLNNRVKNLSTIQKAKDLRLIVLDQNKKSWWMLDGEKKPSAKLCDVLAATSPHDSLEFAIAKDKSIMDSIEESVRMYELSESS